MAMSAEHKAALAAGDVNRVRSSYILRHSHPDGLAVPSRRTRLPSASRIWRSGSKSRPIRSEPSTFVRRESTPRSR